MTVNECFELVNYISNKNLNGGNITPDNFNLIINQGQHSYISYLLGTFQKYTPGRAVAPVEFGQNQVIRQRLTPVIYGYILGVDSSGFSPYPGDFLQVDAMWSIYGYARIRAVQQDSWYLYYNSVIDPVATNPIYMIKDVGFQFAPESIGSARMSYVRVPPPIYWAYTLDVNGLPAYDVALSVDPVFDDLSMLEIISRALMMIGINLQSAAIGQYANEITKIGQ